MTPEHAAKMWIEEGDKLSGINSEITALRAEMEKVQQGLSEAKDTLERSVSSAMPRRAFVVNDKLVLLHRRFGPVGVGGPKESVSIEILKPGEVVVVEVVGNV